MKIFFSGLLFLILNPSSALYAQEKENVTYILKKSEKIQNISDYNKALSTAQFDCYRILDQRRVLLFDNGLVVELFSVEEMEKNGLKPNKNCLTNPASIVDEKRVFSLASNGYIIEKVTPAPTKFRSE